MTAEELYCEWEGMSAAAKDRAMAKVMRCHCPEFTWRPSSNLNQAALVVAAIERQGLWSAWMIHLENLVGEQVVQRTIVRPDHYLEFRYITASADLRCAAAWIATKVREQEKGDG